MTSDPLRLAIFGEGYAVPERGDPCSGYLVSGGGTRLWVDAGITHVDRSVGPRQAVDRAAALYGGAAVKIS